MTRSPYNRFKSYPKRKSTFKVGGTMIFRDHSYVCKAIDKKQVKPTVTWETACFKCGERFNFNTGLRYSFAMRLYCDKHRPLPNRQWVDMEIEHDPFA
jgi:hypothetical protein